MFIDASPSRLDRLGKRAHSVPWPARKTTDISESEFLCPCSRGLTAGGSAAALPTQFSEEPFIFDAVGKLFFKRCRGSLKPGGIYTSTDLGPYWQNPFLALWTSRIGDQKVVFPIPHYTKRDVLFVKELSEAGKYRPVIDRRYALEDVVEANRYVETGQKTGMSF